MRAHQAISKIAICLVFLFAALAALPGGAAWLESDQGTQPTRWIPRPTPYPYPTPDPYPYPTPVPDPGDRSARAIRDFLGGAYLGTPYGWGGLTVVPVLVSNGTPSPSLRSLESALRSGDLTVREYGSGSVPTVEMVNRGGTPVFLLAGEIVLGGKQDRVIREDTVIGAYSGPVQVAVYCVEQGRWAGTPSGFAAAPHAIADRDLRSKAAAGAGQDEVWSHVAKESEARGVRSPTSSYGDVVSSPDVSRRLDEYVARCPRPSPWRGRAVGAVFLSGSTVLGVDLFGDPGLLSSLWPKLIRSYASQAMHGGGYTRHGGGDASSASRVLEALRAAWPTWDGSAGAAPRYRLGVGGYDAWAVTWSDAVVHVAALPGTRYYEPPPPPPPPYDRYSPYDE